MLIEYRGFNITVEKDTDTDVDSPRTWNNFGTMVCWHSKYILGDVQPTISPNDYIYNLFPLDVHERIDDLGLDDENWNARIWSEFSDRFVHLPIYMYEHGGITIRTTPFSCPWDSSQIGFIYISNEDADKAFLFMGNERLDARECLIAEVEIYNQYLTGDVWYYSVDDHDGNFLFGCGDVYGYDDAVKMAKEEIDHHVRHEITEKQKRIKDMIMNRVPLDVRERELRRV